MIAMMHLLLQATTQPASPGGPGAPQATPGDFLRSPMFLLLLMIGVFYIFMFRGSRKDKKHREEMLKALAKNDRVLTIGGIIATVVSVRDDEVVIKVDESTNTKMTVIRSAIRRVLTPEEKPADKE